MLFFTATASTIARAEEPAVLYVPNEDITLVPLAGCSVHQPPSTEYNSALGCGGIEEEASIPAYGGDLDSLMDGLQDSLAPYDVHVTNERPPSYVPYHMLVPVTASLAQELGLETCASTQLNCGAQRRNRIAIFVAEQTGSCTEADPLQSALYAFGRMSGLEGVDAPTDPMNEPAGIVPPGSQPATTFRDSCLPLAIRDDSARACTELDHVGCDAGNQNGHEELLWAYGRRRADDTPPTIDDVEPQDGTEIPWPESVVVLDATITDEDPNVAFRWTIASPVSDDAFTVCTNRVCSLLADPNIWPLAVGIDAHEHVVTLEASDLHGNLSAPVMHTVSFAPPPPLPPENGDAGTSTGMVSGGSSETETGSTSRATDDDAPPSHASSSGCRCVQTEPMSLPRLDILFVCLSGLLVRRERDQDSESVMR